MRGDAQHREHKVVAARTHILDTARTSPERSPGAASSRGLQRTTSNVKGVNGGAPWGH